MDEPTRLTRKDVIKRGAAVTLFVAVGVGDAAGSAAADPSTGDVEGGIFRRALDSRSAVVTLTGGGEVEVRLTPDAFMQHGDEGAVDDMHAFVPGERVAIRGRAAGATFEAHDFQSVYTEEVGTVVLDASTAETLEAAGGGTLDAPGGSVRVPSSVQTAAGQKPVLRSGEAAAATIWTNPATGARTAVLMTPRS